MTIRTRRPAITIVTATYNRSRALACAIESARRQSFSDWEMIVVGDACTDDAGVVPGSCWLVRRDVLMRLGGWRLARDCAIEPSQDLLFRAWRAGYRVYTLNLLTLVIIPSGTRAGSYLHGEASEQEWVLGQL